METTQHSSALSPAVKMNAYRQRMRDAGLRPVQIWIPDTRSVGLQEEAKRQSLSASKHISLEHDITDFIDIVADW